MALEKTNNIIFPKLKDPERFPQWNFFLKTWLQGEGLWEYVTGENPEPYPLVLDTATGIYTRAIPNDTAHKKQKAWEQGDAKTRTKIIQLLDEMHFAKFATYTTAKSLWEALHETFEDSSTQNILLWWLDLTQTRLEDGDPLQPHFDKVLEASCKLASAGFSVPEPLLVMVILVSLPSTYENKVTLLHMAITALPAPDRT
jgi:hypothetical protein